MFIFFQLFLISMIKVVREYGRGVLFRLGHQSHFRPAPRSSAGMDTHCSCRIRRKHCYNAVRHTGFANSFLKERSYYV